MYLGENPRDELSGLETYILECHENSRIAWVPQGKSKYLERNESVEGGGDKVAELEAKLELVSQKMEKFDKTHKRVQNLEKIISEKNMWSTGNKNEYPLGGDILRDSRRGDGNKRGSDVGLLHASSNAPWLYRDMMEQDEPVPKD